jgi:cytochrome c oxidase subunit 3
LSAESHGALHHQFDDLHQQKSAVTLGMWLFLATEVMFFGGLFLAYILYRGLYPQAFAVASSHLDVTLGGLNTAVLIGSSFTMAMAVHSAEDGNSKAIARFVALTMLLGAVFLGVKAYEYHHKWVEQLVPGPGFLFEGGAHGPQVEIFFLLYFIMTGLHALHMVIGMGIMAMLLKWNAEGRFADGYASPVHVSGLYWHFVDIIWIFLFPLLYLIARHHG